MTPNYFQPSDVVERLTRKQLFLHAQEASLVLLPTQDKLWYSICTVIYYGAKRFVEPLFEVRLKEHQVSSAKACLEEACDQLTVPFMDDIQGLRVSRKKRNG